MLKFGLKIEVNPKIVTPFLKKGVNQQRIGLLEKLIDENPSDPFHYYALALEFRLANTGRAEELFEYLIHHHPQYLATYYQAAILLDALGKKQRALKLIDDGMEIAKYQNNTKTLGELRTLKDELLP